MLSAPPQRRTATRRPARHAAIGIIVVLALALTSCLTPGQDHALSHLNNDRRNAGRSRLTLQRDAQAKAQAWAEKLARDNRLSHSNLSSGIRVRWCSLGENVGYGSTTASIQASFMASPVHRANVLDGRWNGVGIGVATRGNRVFVVQFFIKTC